MQPLLDGVWAWRVWRPGSFQGVSFNGHALKREGGVVLVDPPPVNAWELEHLESLRGEAGGSVDVVITNANHVRAAVELSEALGAAIHVPQADAERCAEAGAEGAATYAPGDTVAGLRAIGLSDQKTPGESGLYLESRKLLILGDALIGTPSGLSLLPDAKYKDPAAAREGLRPLLELQVETLLLGDGESVLKGAMSALRTFFTGPAEVELETTPEGARPRDDQDGWYVLNLADSAWLTHPEFGSFSNLEGRRGRFGQVGVNVSIVESGKPACLYHREDTQEGFLVLSGECRLLIEEQERALRPWDYVHCPAGVAHLFVGGDSGPCAILMLGARAEGKGVTYPVSELAARYGGSVKVFAPSPEVAYSNLNQRPQPTTSPWPLGS